MQDNYLLKISKFFLYIAPFSAAIVYGGTLFPFIVGKYVFFRLAVELAAVFFVWAWVQGEFEFSRLKRKVFKNPLFISILVFGTIFILAGFLGYNPSASFWSNYERGEGGLQMIHLMAFFGLMALIFENWKDWRRILVLSLISGILVIVYGVLGALNIDGFVGQSLCSRFAGSLGNAAYVGTYSIFMIFYAAILLANDWKNDWLRLRGAKKWLWIGLIILFLVFLLLSQTRGAVLGLAAAILVFLAYLVFALDSKKVKKFLVILIGILLATGILAVKYRKSIDLMPFCGEQGGNRILDITLNTENAQTRFLLWQQAIKAFGDRPLLGWGPENFTPAFEKYYNTKFDVWYDRAHNIFFDYLVMTGFFGLLSFIVIFISFYWQFFKSNKRLTTNDLQYNKNEKKLSVAGRWSVIGNALFFVLPVAYLVQGLVLFDVLPIYINLFIFLAFANFALTQNNENK